MQTRFTGALFIGLVGSGVLAGAASCGSEAPAGPGPSDGGAEASLEASAPTKTLSADDLRDSTKCGECHVDHYKDWSASMHAYASDDPVFVAMNKRGQRETNGQLGSFCVNCHAPLALRDGKTKDGLNLAELDPREKGVGCYFCHSIKEVSGRHNGAVILADDGVLRGPFDDPVDNPAHAAAGGGDIFDSQRKGSSNACGACHDIVNGHGASIERTFQEWQDSLFSLERGGVSCIASCHMLPSPKPRPIATKPANVRARYYHGHQFAAVDAPLTPDFPAVDTAAGQAAQQSEIKRLLDSTLAKEICVKPVGANAAYRVIVDSIGAGHSFPSGSAQDRRLWFEINAYKNGERVYASGNVPVGESPNPAKDPDLWLLRDTMFDQDNKTPVSMFWQAQCIDSYLFTAPTTLDPTSPDFYNTHVLQSFPRVKSQTASPLPDRVTLQVHLQPMGLDVLDDLVASGDLDPTFKAAMPVYDVGPTIEWTPEAAALPSNVGNAFVEDNIKVTCVTDGTIKAAEPRTLARTNSCDPDAGRSP